jgi:hypothetical protein
MLRTEIGLAAAWREPGSEAGAWVTGGGKLQESGRRRAEERMGACYLLPQVVFPNFSNATCI